MRRAPCFLLPFLLALPPCAQADLVVLGEDVLGEETAQAGIALEMEWMLNARPPAAAATAATLDDPATAPVPDACTGTGNPCTLAFSFANRPGEWLVLKDTALALRIFTLNLDGVQMATAAGADTGCGSTCFDVAKFRNETGACLLPTGVACTAAGVGSLRALRFGFPERNPAYSAATGRSTGYNSVQLFMSIGRVAVQYDNRTVAGAGYLPGQDVGQSFMGLRISDNNHRYAGMSISGDVYVYGF